MRTALAFLIAGVSMLGGLIIYVVGRGSVVALSVLFRNSLPGNAIAWLESAYDVLSLPQWLVGCLPDALWMLALCLVILAVWNFRITRSSLLWLSIALLMGTTLEIAQTSGNLIGTFDTLDLVALGCASLFSLLFTVQFRRHEEFS